MLYFQLIMLFILSNSLCWLILLEEEVTLHDMPDVIYVFITMFFSIPLLIMTIIATMIASFANYNTRIKRVRKDKLQRITDLINL